MKSIIKISLVFCLYIVLCTNTSAQPIKKSSKGLDFNDCSITKIEILQANQVSEVTFVKVATWENSFHEPDILPSLKEDFYEWDESRIIFRCRI